MLPLILKILRTRTQKEKISQNGRVRFTINFEQS